MPGLWAAGDGCTIFGGLVLNKGLGGGAPSSKTAPVSKAAVPASAPASSGAGAAPGGNDPNASPMLAIMMAAAMGGGKTKNILEEEGSPCGGLGAAFLSGYYCGINAGNYIKNS